jgi:cation diffusion facilitator CzcD-associated flavoprotein CzcO
MSESVDVAIIGAGQAGLATSWYLQQAKVDHVILEAGRVAETWRSRRWDSFCLVTPNWSVALPGGKYDGPDPDGFMSRQELVAHIERWADSFEAPVQGSCQVTALSADGDDFELTTSGGKIRARTVVVASGGYQRAHLPANAHEIRGDLKQILAEDYTNPTVIPPGAVLIVGGGQTGCQLAEELHEAGRKVFLSCGRCLSAPRRMGGKDVVWWIVESGFWARTPDQLPSPGARLLGNPQATGHGGGHDLNYRTLHAKGVELVGRYLGADGVKAHFDPNLSAIFDAGDAMSAYFKTWVDALCEKRGLPLPWEIPPPLRVDGRTELDITLDDIATVIWTSGYRPAYGWVHFPVFDDMGFPIQVDGRSAVPGLYFMGVHFQRKAQSAVLYGVGEDAELVARDIAENRR